jgi:valyl-tRNA synthetase
VTQDEACLDTWFSSALWPFSTLGFPDKTDDLKAFYPGSVLVTAYDIIFFWVARMIFSGLYHMGSVPFEKVLIHGIVRDEQGRKMSKSLGNGVDPIKIIDEYGTDSLRFCLLSGVALGSDIRYSTQKLQRAQAFINKLWNASRFVLLKLEGVALCDFDEIKTIQLSVADRWILTRLNQTVQKIHKNFDKFELGRVADCLYDFVWDDFCDWYIEIAKTQLQENKQIAASVLSYLLQNILIILHPIIPFVTEYLHSQFCTHQVLAVKNFPKKIKEFKKDAQQFENVKQLIVATRILRADNGIAQNVKSTVFVEGKQQYSKVLQSCKLLVQKLTFSDSVTMGVPSGENYVKWSGEIGTAYLQLQKIDIETINKKLVQNLQLAQKELSLAKSKLNSQGFMSKAPLKLVQAEQEKVEKYSKIIQSIETQMVKNYGQK